MDPIRHSIDESAAGERLDRFLAAQHPEISRSEIQRDIRSARVTVGGETARHPSRRLKLGEIVVWQASDRVPLAAREMPLEILYEDDHLVVVDKPIGLVVHPGAGTNEPTLVEGLLHGRSLPPSDDPVRPGIVHRLDKETSGILVVAKTAHALESLKRQFADRLVLKEYLAVVDGDLTADEGRIDAPVGRDPRAPRRMAVQASGRKAVTEFQVLARLGGRSLLWVQPRTGRTHQIRVHLRYIGHAVAGDRIYGRGDNTSRLLLHAWRIGFTHPATEEAVRFEAPVPEGFPEFGYTALPWRVLDHAERA